MIAIYLTKRQGRDTDLKAIQQIILILLLSSSRWKCKRNNVFHYLRSKGDLF